MAVIVHPDGTEELIKESLPTEGGVQLTVDGSVTVKIVDNAKDFKDTKNHWAADSIDFVSARGLVNGTGSDSFDPNTASTRAQMVTMLWRAAGSPKADGANAFNDVPTGSYYADAIAWAAAHGITTGVGNGAFDPNGTCTRAQIAAFLHRSYLSE